MLTVILPTSSLHNSITFGRDITTETGRVKIALIIAPEMQIFTGGERRLQVSTTRKTPPFCFLLDRLQFPDVSGFPGKAAIHKIHQRLTNSEPHLILHVNDGIKTTSQSRNAVMRGQPETESEHELPKKTITVTMSDHRSLWTDSDCEN